MAGRVKTNPSFLRFIGVPFHDFLSPILSEVKQLLFQVACRRRHIRASACAVPDQVLRNDSRIHPSIKGTGFDIRRFYRLPKVCGTQAIHQTTQRPALVHFLFSSSDHTIVPTCASVPQWLTANNKLVSCPNSLTVLLCCDFRDRMTCFSRRCVTSSAASSHCFVLSNTDGWLGGWRA